MHLSEPPSLLPAQLLRGGSLAFPVGVQENVEENRTPQSQKPALEKSNGITIAIPQFRSLELSYYGTNTCLTVLS